MNGPRPPLISAHFALDATQCSLPGGNVQKDEREENPHSTTAAMTVFEEHLDGRRRTPDEANDVEKHVCVRSPSTSTATIPSGVLSTTCNDSLKDHCNYDAFNNATVTATRWSRKQRKIGTAERGTMGTIRESDTVPTDRAEILRSIPLHSVLRPLRHSLHVLILVAGWMLGTVIFYAIEVPAERHAVAATYGQLNDAFKSISDELNIAARLDNETDLAEHVKKAYIQLLEIEGKWRWSAIQKTEGPEAHYMWTFASSFFFTFTLFTTVGYGSIYPGTDLGRVAVILYSCVFYPFSLVVIRDLGQLTLIGMTKVYGKVLIKIRSARGYLTTDWESITLPWSITAIISIVFIALCAVLFKLYDDAVGPDEGLSYFIAFYFSFLSMTAIGLGDIMPNNEPWAPIVAIIVLAGLPLMKVITRMTYARMENGYFGVILLIESRLLGVKQEEEKEVVTQKVEDDADCRSIDSEDDNDEMRIREEVMRNFTVHSLAKYISSGKDVYGGEFGRVSLRRNEL